MTTPIGKPIPNPVLNLYEGMLTEDRFRELDRIIVALAERHIPISQLDREKFWTLIRAYRQKDSSHCIDIQRLIRALDRVPNITDRKKFESPV